MDVQTFCLQGPGNPKTYETFVRAFELNLDLTRKWKLIRADIGAHLNLDKSIDIKGAWIPSEFAQKCITFMGDMFEIKHDGKLVSFGPLKLESPLDNPPDNLPVKHYLAVLLDAGMSLTSLLRYIDNSPFLVSEKHKLIQEPPRKLNLAIHNLLSIIAGFCQIGILVE